MIDPNRRSLPRFSAVERAARPAMPAVSPAGAVGMTADVAGKTARSTRLVAASLLCRTGLLACLLTLSGCVSIPNTYAPPMERKPVTGYGSSAPASVVSMNDPSANAYIVKDISGQLESGAWRWTGKRPELRFALSRVQGLKLAVDFAIAKETFDATGPVTISFFVNDRLLEAVRHDQPGNKHFEKPVPADWLRTDAYTRVAAEIDKVYRSPQDGAELGFILIRAGFIE